MEGREHSLDPGATLGREGCDVNLMDPEVSRHHAAIREQGGALAIEDLGSTNGTFVNGQRITVVTVLRDGDSVRLGNTVWSIRSAAVAVADVTAAQPAPAGGGAAPAAPPEPAAAPSAPPAGPRGDVEAPPEVAPSAIRRVLPPPAPGQAPQFSPPGPRPGGSAATRVEATVVAMIIVAVVAALLVVYFVTY